VAGEEATLKELNPTLVDGLWPWRAYLNEAAAVVSTLGHAEAVQAATAFAHDQARRERSVVLAAVGTGEPLYCEVPEARRLDCVRPDLLLLLVHNAYTASSRLLITTARQVVLITGLQATEQDAARQLIGLLLDKASPVHLQIVVVADSRDAADAAGGELLRAAASKFAQRTGWSYLPSQRVRKPVSSLEDSLMTSSSATVPISEAQNRSQQWEDSFRRAELLLAEAQQTLAHQLERSAMALHTPPPPEPPRASL
jgi:hypothetical protein